MGPLRDGTDHLRVLIANERKDRLAQVAPIVIALGHQVIALLHAPDPTFLREAAKRGVFAHISDDDVE
ncbi:MAG: hypothetical protein ABSH36_19060, partial [Solirubrobacteraceae bacterium]